MKILYVTRKFPPTIGGMENVAAWLYEALRPLANVRLVKYGGANKYLPVVYPWLVLRALVTGWVFRPDVIYVQDGLMGAATPIFKALLRRPVVVTIHGTELVYAHPLYVRVVIPALQRVDAVVAISAATQDLVRKKIPNTPTKLIHWGVHDDLFIDQPHEVIKKRLGELVGFELSNRPVIYLMGRMTERKGARWFVEQVMPELVKREPRIVCLIAGGGKDLENVRAAIESHGLTKSIVCTGYVIDEVCRVLHNGSDLFIMPNRSGFGFEGFGMVTVEATSCGTPAVVGAFAGTVDTVVDGKTGWLVPVDDSNAYVERIMNELLDPTLSRESVRETTLDTFNWERTAKEYIEVLSEATIKEIKK